MSVITLALGHHATIALGHYGYVPGVHKSYYSVTARIFYVMAIVLQLARECTTI